MRICICTSQLRSCVCRSHAPLRLVLSRSDVFSRVWTADRSASSLSSGNRSVRHVSRDKIRKPGIRRTVEPIEKINSGIGTFNEISLTEDSYTIYDFISSPPFRPSSDDISLSDQLGISLQKIEFICSSLATLEKYDNLEARSTYSLSELSDLMIVSAKARAPEAAENIIDEIKCKRRANDDISFPLLALMCAYSRIGDRKSCMKIFFELENMGFGQDSRLWSILIEASVRSGELEDGFLILEEALDNKVIPKLEMYNILVEGCIEANDLRRAWSVYDHSRIRVSYPNLRTYNLMISACCKSKSVEKGLSLFSEVSETNAELNLDIFNSIIKCCGTRKESCLKAFELFEQMVFQEIEPDMNTYENLLLAASTSGEIKRAALVLNDLIDKIQYPKTNKEYHLTPEVFSYLFLSCSEAVINTLNTSPLKVNDELFSDFCLRKEIQNLPNTTESKSSALCISPENAQFSLMKEENVDAVATNATSVLEYARKAIYIIQKNKHYISSNVLDSILRLITKVPVNESQYGEIVEFFETSYAKFNCLPTTETFITLLAWLNSESRIASLYVDKVAEAYFKFDNEMELSLFGKIISSRPEPLSEILMEDTRMKQKRDKLYTLKIFIDMANALALANRVQDAVEIIKKSRTFRYKDYLPKMNTDCVLTVFFGCYNEYLIRENIDLISSFAVLVEPSRREYFCHFDKPVEFSPLPETPFIEDPKLDFTVPWKDMGSDHTVNLYECHLHKENVNGPVDIEKLAKLSLKRQQGIEDSDESEIPFESEQMACENKVP